MDQNNEITDIQNMNIGQCDYNSWFYYQPPYLNVSQCNIIPNELLWNYPTNIPMNNGFSQNYIDHSSNRNQLHNSITINNFPNYQQNKIKVPSKNDESQKLSRSANQKEKNETTTSTKKMDVKFRGNDKTKTPRYEVLPRNKILVGVLSEVTETVKSLDIDKDFPPISTSHINFKDIKSNGNDKILDFKLALQTPKKAVETKEPAVSKEATININEGDVIKKKRKRKRKKKAILEELKTFEFVDEDFPNLDNVQVGSNVATEKLHTKQKDKDNTVNSFIEDKDKKKSRRRQLLFILPKQLEGQVRIVEAQSIKKSKIKRKVFQDRLKKPIGSLNPLDLSGPSIKRGKERLIPKVKKPTKVKKSILLCRSQKKDIRDAFKNMSLMPNDKEDADVKHEETVENKSKITDNPINKMHSKNFREYCNHMVGNNINSIISTLLKTLITFQDNLFNRDPVKAKMKRRLCFGLREVTKFVTMKRLRLIIIAPDLEKVDIQGGLDDIVVNVIKVARESSIPCVFGLNRGSLAYLCFKKFRVGAIGVFNYDGAESHVKELLKAVDEAREQYNQLKQIMESITHDVTVDEKDYGNQHNNNVYVGHSRTPSNALSEPISDIVEVNKSTFNSIFEDQNLNSESRDVTTDFDEDVEDSQIEAYVEEVLNSVLKLNINE